MTTAPRRGRPTVFDEPARRRFLDAIATGMPIGQAVQLVGVNRDLPRRHARTDPAFAAQLSTAQAAGRAARVAEVPHGESRYTNYACRCDTCRTAATAARTGRRHTDTPPTPDTPAPVVVTLPPAAGSCPPSSLLLAKAS
ncbi:hypothetical protein [Streptomyces sp. NPDC101145]|uniref:hypothetical protein n=1 Tax=Streptomyces sp. NPDC101145 TaxID=3366112 RepID=UPI00380B3043